MAAQAAEIDGVSGATITSKAVSKAAAKCIAQAKGEIPVEVISDKKTDEDDGDWLGKGARNRRRTSSPRTRPTFSSSAAARAASSPSPPLPKRAAR